MSEREVLPPEPTGPFLQAAMICEKVLIEQDGVISIIRAIDRLTATLKDGPPQMPKVGMKVLMVVTFRAGSARGRHKVTIRPETPMGMRLQTIDVPILFESEERGSNLQLEYAFEAEHEGVYWFDVLMDDRLVTRMPLRLYYQPV